MISSVNSLATNAVTVLTGPRRAAVPVEPVAPVKTVKRRSGHTDDVFKAGNAIGTMIGIASALHQTSRTPDADNADSMDEPAADAAMQRATTDRAPTEPFSEERSLEAVRQQASGTGPRAEWARAYLEAQEKRGAKT